MAWMEKIIAKQIVEEKISLMKPENFWKNLDDNNKNAILKIASVKQYHTNQIVFQQEEIFTGFYIVKNGKFKIYKLKEDGKEIIINIMTSGNIIAAPILFSEEKIYPANLEALEPGQLYYISEINYCNFIKQYPEFQKKLLEILSKYVINLKERFVSISLESIEERIINYLIDLGAKYQYVPLSIAKKQLALLLGSTPETISRIFNKLNKEKKLICKDSTYRLMID